MIRRNRETGKMERLDQATGEWHEIVDPEHDQAWDAIEGMFREVDAGLEKEAQDAAGPVAAGSDAGGDLGPADSDSDRGPVQVVPVAQVQEQSDGSGRVTVSENNEFIDEIPGLTVSDGKTGVRGSRGVLQRLRQGAKKRNTPKQDSTTERVTKESGRAAEEPSRAPKRVEVAESAAHARGPAVRDTTEHRQLAKTGKGDKGTDSSPRIVSKPAPGILSDQPKWVRELFEAHFRSSLTRELRHKPSGPDRVVDGVVVTPNRMKMSREDFAIGWLVCFEFVKKNPELLRVRVQKNGIIAPYGQNSGGTPVLPAAANTNS